MSQSPAWFDRGKFRIVVTRAVSEEETVSLECLEDDYATAKERALDFARACHKLMAEYNRTVVRSHRQQLSAVNDMIAERAGELRSIEARILQQQQELEQGALVNGSVGGTEH